jgi:hypothetical protein
MGDKDSKPILVTGAHRSGTTWVGKMLSATPGVAYISEPLNVWHRPGVLRTPTQYWYTYIYEENQEEYQVAFEEMLNFEYHTWLEFKSLRSIKDVLRMGRDWGTFWTARRYSRTALIKDPFALFSCDWFADHLDCQVVIVVRHPAAVASSLSRLGWRFDFSDMLNQPQLMRDWLEPFQADMQKMIETNQDVIAQSSLLWRMLYRVTAEIIDKRSQYFIVRHEDLSAAPLAQFKQLYNALNLEFSAQSEQAIKMASSESNLKEVSPRNVHSVRVDSRAKIKQWQLRLSEADIDRVRQLTSDVAPLYYSEEDWH